MTRSPVALPRRITRAEVELTLHVDNLRRRTAAGDASAVFALLAVCPAHDVYAALATAPRKRNRLGTRG
ncbi:hypothetical protein [Streptomyces alfalfae]